MDNPLGLGLLAWRTLTAAINEIKPVPRLLQQLVFKRRNTNPTDTIDVDVIKGNETLVPFVTPIEGGTVINNLGREQRTIKTPRMRPKKQLDAQKLLSTPMAGMGFYAGGAADISKAQQQKVALELKDLRNGVDRTIEWMCAQALTGLLTVNQKNIAFQVNYRLSTANKPTLTGDNVWGGSAGDIPGNLRAWAELIRAATGSGPDLILLGSDAAAKFEADEDIKAELNNRNYIVGELKPSFQEDFVGVYKGAAVYRYPFDYVTGTGTKAKMLGSKTVVMVNTKADFSIEFGHIIDLKAKANVQAEFFSKAWEQEDPSALWLLAESRPLPVCWAADSYVYATVL